MIYYNPINALNNKTEVNHFTFDWSIINKTFSFIHLDFFISCLVDYYLDTKKLVENRF